MSRAVGVCMLWLVLSTALSAQEQVGYLVTHVICDPKGNCEQQTIPYYPCEGDLVFFNDHSAKWGLLYKMVGSDGPYHAALICKLPNGRSAIVEAGPNDTFHCRVLEIEPRFSGFGGTVSVRRYKKGLDAEQSAALTKWSLEQDNKRYALGRLLLQATPVRARMPLRKEIFGATYTDRNSYLCAELAVAAGTVAGIFDPKVHKANTIYPRDIVANDVYDLSALYHDVQNWTPTPAGVLPPVRPEVTDRYLSLKSALPLAGN